MGDEIVVAAERTDLALVRDPTAIVRRAADAAKALRDVVTETKTSTRIGDREHLNVEAWQTVAQFYGETVRTLDAFPVEVEGVKGAKARAEVIDGRGNVTASGEAFCMRDERQWGDRSFAQLASMAQTRAASKALRNRFAWVVVLAGYATTPGEEIDAAHPIGASPSGAAPPAASRPASASSSRSPRATPAGSKGRQPERTTVVTGITGVSILDHGERTDGSPWTLHGVETMTGTTYSTFSASLAKLAEDAKRDGVMVRLTWEPTARGGKRVVAIEDVTDPVPPPIGG